MDTHSKNAFEIFKFLEAQTIVNNIKYLPDEKNKIINYGKNIIKINKWFNYFSIKKEKLKNL